VRGAGCRVQVRSAGSKKTGICKIFAGKFIRQSINSQIFSVFSVCSVVKNPLDLVYVFTGREQSILPAPAAR